MVLSKYCILIVNCIGPGPNPCILWPYPGPGLLLYLSCPPFAHYSPLYFILTWSWPTVLVFYFTLSLHCVFPWSTTPVYLYHCPAQPWSKPCILYAPGLTPVPNYSLFNPVPQPWPLVSHKVTVILSFSYFISAT